MTKKQKIFLTLSASITSVLAITIPTSLYVESTSIISQKNDLTQAFSATYLKELNAPSINLVKNQKDTAQQIYNNLPTTHYSYFQLVNGDKQINHGNYLLLLGNQFDLAYQAIAYSNFVNNKNIYNFKTLYDSPFYNCLQQLGWNIPVFEYIDFPTLTNLQVNQTAPTPYYVYETFFGENTNSLKSTLYNNMVNYASTLWNLKTNVMQNNLILLGFKNGYAKQCQFTALNTFLDPSSGSSPLNVSPNGVTTQTSNSTSQITYGTYIDTKTKQKIVTSYTTTLNNFLLSVYNHSKVSKAINANNQQTATEIERNKN